jgi:hypothetical protein
VLATVSDAVGMLTNDVAGTIAPVEAAAQPVLATVSDAVGSLTNDVAGTIAPVEAAAQPVLATVSDAVGSLTNDVAGTIAPVEAAVQPVLATVTDAVGTLPNDVISTIAPVETAAPPLLAADAALPVVGDVPSLDAPVITDVVDPAHMGYLTGEVQLPVPDLLGAIAADTAGSTAPTALDPIVAAGSSGNQASDPLQAADPVGNLAAHAPATAGAVVDGVDPALAPAPGSDADPSSHGVADTSNVAAHHIGSSGWVLGAVAPVVPDLVHGSQAAAPDTTGGLTEHAVASAAPVVDTAGPLLAAMTGTASQPATLSHTVVSDSAGAQTLGSSAPALDVAEPATPATGSSATGDVAQPGNMASDALANAAPVVDTTEPALPSAVVSLSNPATDLLQPGVPGSSTGQAAGPADTLLALATATDAPIEVPGSATAAPANVVTGTSNAAAAVHPTAIAGDVIALNDAPTPPAHALFTGSQYTDYGVTLSSDIAIPPQHAVSPADSASAHDTLVPVVADAQKHAPPPPEIVDTTHPIDHLGHAIL